jgi:(S)-ureidoglycine aminohydrolase
MLEKFEMHLSTLNPGIKSHDPHTHSSDEIILMIKGYSQKQIGEAQLDASEGD